MQRQVWPDHAERVRRARSRGGHRSLGTRRTSARSTSSSTSLHGDLFRGKLTKIDMSAAIAYSGDLQIELIYQHDDAPSIYTELPRGGRSGLQHIRA